MAGEARYPVRDARGWRDAARERHGTVRGSRGILPWHFRERDRPWLGATHPRTSGQPGPGAGITGWRWMEPPIAPDAVSAPGQLLSPEGWTD